MPVGHGMLPYALYVALPVGTMCMATPLSLGEGWLRYVCRIRKRASEALLLRMGPSQLTRNPFAPLRKSALGLWQPIYRNLTVKKPGDEHMRLYPACMV